jgi:hypothetical protein
MKHRIINVGLLRRQSLRERPALAANSAPLLDRLPLVPTPTPSSQGSLGNPLLVVPNIQQPDEWSCGACAALGVAAYFNVERHTPSSLARAANELGTTKAEGTDPPAIVAYLRRRGLRTEARSGMSVSDLASCCARGWPVICSVQDYGPERPKLSSLAHGHWLTVVGVALGRVFCQDPYLDRACGRTGTIAEPGKVMVLEADWMRAWRDRDAEGDQWVRFGIAVGPPLVLATHSNPEGCNQYTGPGCAAVRDAVATAKGGAVHRDKLAERLGMPPHLVQDVLDRMVAEGKLKRVSANVYVTTQPAKEAPAARPKPPPPSSQGSASLATKISPELLRQVHLTGAKQFLAKGLDEATSLTDAHKAEYREHAHAVMDRMSTTALEQMNKGARSYEFHPSLEALTASMKAREAKLSSMSPDARIGGAYDGRSRTLILDGGGLHMQGVTDPVQAQGLYAHEMAHAVDGPFKSISSTPEWRTAFRDELKGGQLSKYGATVEHEGLAEFGRALWGGAHSKDEVEKQFPRCAAVFKRYGLWE